MNIKLLSILGILTLIPLVGCRTESLENKSKALFDYTPMENIKILDTVKIINNSENSCFFKWDFGDGTTSGKKEPYHIYTSSGTYKIKLQTSNEEGLSDSISKIIYISDEFSLNNFNVRPWIDAFSFDVDRDGHDDFWFSAYSFSDIKQGINIFGSYIVPIKNYEIFTDSISIPYKTIIPKKFKIGDTIENSDFTSNKEIEFCRFHNQGTIQNNLWLSNVDSYVGYRIKVNNVTKIGWIKLRVYDYSSIYMISFIQPIETESLIINK